MPTRAAGEPTGLHSIPYSAPSGRSVRRATQSLAASVRMVRISACSSGVIVGVGVVLGSSLGAGVGAAGVGVGVGAGETDGRGDTGTEGLTTGVGSVVGDGVDDGLAHATARSAITGRRRAAGRMIDDLQRMVRR